MTQLDISEIKARADILVVLDRIGARATVGNTWDEEVQVWCPFCDDAESDKPAGRANSMKGVYHCWSCGFGGDVISIVRERYGYSFDEALQWLIEKFPEESENPWTN